MPQHPVNLFQIAVTISGAVSRTDLIYFLISLVKSSVKEIGMNTRNLIDSAQGWDFWKTIMSEELNLWVS